MLKLPYDSVAAEFALFEQASESMFPGRGDSYIIGAYRQVLTSLIADMSRHKQNECLTALRQMTANLEIAAKKNN